MTTHTFQQFDADLENIRSRILQMGGMVEQQVSNALAALGNGDTDLLEQVITGDKLVNQAEVDLDEACVQLIARHQPIASDLRLVTTVLMMITDLERIGDEAKKIAKAGRLIISSENALVPKIDLRYAAQQATDMLRRSLDAFARLDVAATADIVRQDKEVDAAFKGIMRQLITYMMEDPRTITRSLDLLFIAKSIERVGDHAKNISEYVVYMVRGRDVRHDKLARVTGGEMRDPT